VRVTPGTVAGNLKTRVNPVYPAEAKAKHVEGTVVLRAIISKTGEIENLTVESGPELLQQAAVDAVKRWTYKPYLLNGEPVEVDTKITVNFTFGGNKVQPPPGAEGTPAINVPQPLAWQVPEGAVHVSSGEMAGYLISKVDPIPPDDAHVSGTVLLHALISKTGTVERLQVISGPAMLMGSVIEAVRQRKYKPYLVNGEPVEVDTKIEVTEQFDGSAKGNGSDPNAGLTDQELFDQGAAEMKQGRDEAALFLLRTLLDRYPFVADRDKAGQLPGETQAMLRQAVMSALVLQSRGQYYIDHGVRRGQIGGIVSPPVPIYEVEPRLTSEAKAHGRFQGVVTVNMIVNTKGVPESVHVIRGVGMGLDERAVEAVEQYRFKPAMQDGKPVSVEVNVEVNFQIF
jgi:TonB family protein